MTIIAVFRSRAQCLDYGERLKSHGVLAETVPAPKEAKIGCGLCVRFDARFYVRAKAILKTGKYPTFKGFYKTEFLNGRMTVTPYN